jgi:hypothetical protein
MALRHHLASSLSLHSLFSDEAFSNPLYFYPGNARTYAR